MKEEIKKILVVIKNIFIKKISIAVYIFFVMILGCVIFIKIFSVKVLSNDEIKDEIQNKIININDNDVKVTDDNLFDLSIISRNTKKNEKDIVDIKAKFVNEDKVENVKGKVELTYKGDKWVYESSDFDEVLEMDNVEDLKSFVIESFMKNGFKTIDDKQIYPSSINKISNVEFTSDSVNAGKSFTASMTLYNGVYFQSCKVEGKINYEDKVLLINNLKFISQDKIYKENKIDDLVVKEIALNEVLNGGIFTLEGNEKHIEKNMKLDKNSIKDFVVKEYIVREDYTIRADVQGLMNIEEYKSDYRFDGTVVISSKLSNGNINNAKEIYVYDVPFDSNNEETIEEEGGGK